MTDTLIILHSIKSAGNFFFDRNQFVEACRKYKKAVRYYNFLYDKLSKCTTAANIIELRQKLQPLYQFHLITCLNIAAVELKLTNFVNAKYSCDEVLKGDPKNAKAFYRRGQAEIALKNYDEAIKDLKTAHILMPNNKNILNEFHRAKSHWNDYRNVQKIAYKNLFQRI